MSAITVRVPGCPHPYLSSNGRVNWRGKARVTKEARVAATYAALAALGPFPPAPPSATVDVVIGWGYNRKRIDPTNLWACVKPTVDGIADALDVDDRSWAVGTIAQVRAGRDDPGGFIEITVRPINQE